MNQSPTFSWPVRVYWEDTDAGGVVYYANYLKFLERARTEWLSTLGLEQDRLSSEAGVVFVVRRIEADYLRPARFNDRLTVDCVLKELRGASLVMHQVVRCGDERLLEGVVRIACVDSHSFLPAKIPTFVTEAIRPL